MEPSLNLKGAADYFRERALAGSYKPFPYSGLWIFSGPQGSGKTLLAMHLLQQMKKEYPDVEIVSNISVFGLPCTPFRGIQDFELYNNGDKGIIFLIDEIQTIWSSLQSKNMPESTLTVWSQNRKNRRVILATSQRYTRVAKGIREQCKVNYECRPPFACFYSYRMVDATLYDDAGKYIGEDKPRWSIYIPRVEVMRMYNSLEVVHGKEFDNGMKGKDEK